MPDVNIAERLRRAVRFWRMLAIVSWVVLGLAALGAASRLAVQRYQTQRAVQAEAAARAAAEQALDRAAKERTAAEERLTKAKEDKERMLYFQQLVQAQQALEQQKQLAPKRD